MERIARAGSMMMAERSEKTPLTVMPISRNGKRMSQTMG